MSPLVFCHVIVVRQEPSSGFLTYIVFQTVIWPLLRVQMVIKVVCYWLGMNSSCHIDDSEPDENRRGKLKSSFFFAEYEVFTLQFYIYIRFHIILNFQLLRLMIHKE